MDLTIILTAIIGLTVLLVFYITKMFKSSPEVIALLYYQTMFKSSVKQVEEPSQEAEPEDEPVAKEDKNTNNKSKARDTWPTIMVRHLANTSYLALGRDSGVAIGRITLSHARAHE